MQRIGHGRFDRFVVFWEWSVDHAVAEQPTHALAIHDEREPRVGVVRVHRQRIVGDIADPLTAIPCDPRPRRIPWLAVEVRCGAAVTDASDARPAPRAAWMC